MSESYQQDGYNTVMPYLVADEAPKLADMLRGIFGGNEKMRMESERGSHIELTIGDTVVMVGGGPGQERRTAQLYVYVKDPDATYEKALAAGCKSFEDPADQEYGDRRAGFEDFAGNRWWVARHIGHAHG
jgi:uncharacterized glyoxalase superfamily protein PhnB